jgi:peptidoglycan/xylan/chitin deacetylase (PgdA/CDA1 family)
MATLQMANWRQKAIEAGMGLFRASGVHRLAEPYTRGLGAILMFHRVRPRLEQSFEPNRGLEISATFLDALIGHVWGRGYDILSLDDALAALRSEAPPARPFVVLTFDDGYRDFVDYALPILERRRAPFTAYVTSGFADGSARLWWVEMEEAIRRLDRVDVTVGGCRVACTSRTPSEKAQAFGDVYWRMREGDETELLRVTQALCAQAKIETRQVTANYSLDWRGLELLARCEFATIGAHSVTHARLAKLDPGAAMREMGESRAAIERHLGVTPQHFCYPVGDPTSAGKREFDFAAELKFVSAVTTRPGVLFPEHRDHLHALPRLPVNGRHQTLEALDVLLSGAPFALMNRGRRVLAA